MASSKTKSSPLASTKTRAAHDVIIVGGGIMGSACAWELARHGARVLVLERSVPGAEASSAAAGIVGAQVEAEHPGPLTDLGLLSRQRYPKWVTALHNATGLDVGYRQTGIVKVAFDAAKLRRMQASVRWQRSLKLKVSQWNQRELKAREPSLSSQLKGGLLFESDARIDPAALFKALHIAALKDRVEFRTGAYVKRIETVAGRATGVTLSDGTLLRAPQIVLAAGSWSGLVEGVPAFGVKLTPARGQIVELHAPAPMLDCAVFGPRCYLVPRNDGRTLVGSTLEFVGYKKDVTAGAVRDLLHAALELAPALADTSLGRVWSNFRPYTSDQLPLLGSPDIRGLWVASGHYRTGILLAPITAEIIRCLVLGRRPPLPLDPFSPLRKAE